MEVYNKASQCQLPCLSIPAPYTQTQVRIIVDDNDYDDDNHNGDGDDDCDDANPSSVYSDPGEDDDP